MTQRDLNHAVARATGETVVFVSKVGFSLTVMPRRADWWRRRRTGRPRTGLRASRPL
jgi:hypothetical protein